MAVDRYIAGVMTPFFPSPGWVDGKNRGKRASGRFIVKSGAFVPESRAVVPPACSFTAGTRDLVPNRAIAGTFAECVAAESKRRASAEQSEGAAIKLIGPGVQASYAGAVSRSRSSSQAIACTRLVPHMSAEGCSPPQNAGRSGLPKMRQRLSSPSWMHLTPAGFPNGIPGIGLVIDGAMQHAPQSSRQFMAALRATTGLPLGRQAFGQAREEQCSALHMRGVRRDVARGLVWRHGISILRWPAAPALTP